MANIDEYVKDAKASGMSEDDIRKNLSAAGWKEQDIDSALGAKQAPSPAAAQGTNTMAIISLVLAFFLPFLAWIFSIIALKQISKTGEKGKGAAIAGLILSILFSLVIILVVVGVVFFAYNVMDKVQNMPEQCEFEPGLICNAHTVTSDAVILEMIVDEEAYAGENLTLTGAEMRSCPGETELSYAGSGFQKSFPRVVSPGDKFMLKFTGCEFQGTKIYDSLVISYQVSGLELNNAGVLIADVK